MKKEIKFRGVVDRFEGQTAVVLLGEEEQEAVELPKKFLPEGVVEGDILTVKIKGQKDRTKEAKEKVSRLIENLQKKM